jgi:hypothetical protein
MRHQIVERAILAQPFHRGLGTAFVHARHIVDGVADQREVIHDAVRRHAKLGQHAGLIQCFVAHGVDQRHLAVHQLREVFIAGGDNAAPAAQCGLQCQRADHIVRLDPVHHQNIPAERGDGFMQRFYLRGEFRRHGRAVRLVLGVQIIAKGFSFGIKYASAIIGRIVSAQAPQHIQHALNRTGWLATRAA